MPNDTCSLSVLMGVVSLFHPVVLMRKCGYVSNRPKQSLDEEIGCSVSRLIETTDALCTGLLIIIVSYASPNRDPTPLQLSHSTTNRRKVHQPQSPSEDQQQPSQQHRSPTEPGSHTHLALANDRSSICSCMKGSNGRFTS